MAHRFPCLDTWCIRVRGPTACGQKPLTLTMSLWERGQEAMTKKVIRNRISAPPPAHRATPQRWASAPRGRRAHGWRVSGK